MQDIFEGYIGLFQTFFESAEKSQLQNPLILEHKPYDRNVYEFVKVLECFGGVIDIGLIEVDADHSLPGIR